MSNNEQPKIIIDPYLGQAPLSDEPWFDPMLVAIRLMRVDNVVIDLDMASRLQVMYEDIANRYMDMAALFSAYTQKGKRDDKS